jgi:hypothetical protein
MHWLGPFIVVEIHDLGAIKLEKLNEIIQSGWVNGARPKTYLYTS